MPAPTTSIQSSREYPTGELVRRLLALAWRYRADFLLSVSLGLVLLLLGLLATQRFFRGKVGARLALSGILLSVVVWCVEVVSLHAVDHILYHLIGKWMVVCALWILACLMTSIGILKVSSQAQPNVGSN